MSSNYQTQPLFEEKNNSLTFLQPAEGNVSSSPDELSSLSNKSASEAVVNSKSNFGMFCYLRLRVRFHLPIGHTIKVRARYQP